MNIKIISHTANPELVVATAAKLCYAGCNIEELMEKQTPEGIAKFITMLEAMGHESPMEHVSFTFAIEGVSRVTEQQLTRHRIASYSIQSGRYVNRSNAKFYMPGDIENLEDAKHIYVDVIDHSKQAYEQITDVLVKHSVKNYLINELKIYDSETDIEILMQVMENEYKEKFKSIKKKAIENARLVFPNSLETKIICTMNVRTLLNFFKHRCCNRAQDEIRELAKEMLKLVREIAPNLFKHAGAACVSGICPENSMQCEQLKGLIPTMKDVKKLINEHWAPAVGRIK